MTPYGVLFALLLAVFASPATAQQPKIPVSVTHSGDDSVGRRMLFEFREAIRGSQSMRLISENEADPRIVVHVVTVESRRSDPGLGTSASVAVVFDSKNIDRSGYFLTNLVQVCGANRTQECARDMAAAVDGELERLRKSWPSYWRLLK